MGAQNKTLISDTENIWEEAALMNLDISDFSPNYGKYSGNI